MSSRNLFLETLEPRQLLANGPELVTVLPNVGAFLADGQVRTEAPRELTLRFSPGQAIDTSTLDGIVITRAGGDGHFEASSVYSDFNTNGAVVIEFDALRLGAGGDGIRFIVTKNAALAVGAPPIISANVATKVINVTLNANPATPTMAQGLVDAINDDTNAAILVRASIRSGVATSDIATPAINYSPLTTGGANAAFAATDFNTGGPLVVRFQAVNSGTVGNGLTVAFKKADLGATGTPIVSVVKPVTNPPTPATITVTLNTNPGNRTTAQGLTTAINASASASVLVRASIPVGSGSTDISTPQVVNPVVLGGADDVTLSPGYEALNGANTNEVIYRFAESLPNDLYRLEVYGTGPGAILRSQSGQAFNNGLDSRLTFGLDLGAQVTAVVPQPVLRDKLITVGSVASLRDGDRIFLTAGGNQVVLEFEDTAISNGVLAGNLPVQFDSGQPAATVAANIAAAIAGSGLDATVTQSLNQVTVKGNAYNPTATLLTSLSGGSAPLSNADGGLTQRPNVVTVYFSNDTLDASSAQNPAFYRLIDTKGTSATTDDTILMPQTVAYNATQNHATLTFASNLPTGTYKLQIGTSQEIDTPLVSALKLGTLYNTGFTTTQFLGDTAAGRSDVDLYQFQLASTGTATVTATPDAALNSYLRLFDAGGTEITSNNAGGPGVADTFTSAPLAAGTYYAGISSSGNNAYNPVDGSNATGGLTTGSYRLDISTSGALAINDDNSSYATATNVGTLGAAGTSISSAITAQTIAIPPLPGDDTPGHREIPVEAHGAGSSETPTAPAAITPFQYNFSDVYGSDPQGNTLHNQITEGQKQLTRDIFELVNRYTGMQFEETARFGLRIVTGDIRAVAPTYPVDAVGGIFGGEVVINALFYGSDNVYGGGWMGVAEHEIGHALGLGHAYDLQAVMGGGNAAETTWSDYDLEHLANLHPPFSTDIDLYKFNVTTAGHVTADVTAERTTPNTSTLDAALTLFRDPSATAVSDFNSTGAVSVQLTAANAGVFGNDVRVVVQTADFGGAANPVVSVSGHTITLTLNTNAGNHTTAQQVVDVINNDFFAKLLVQASIASGAGTADVTGIPTGATIALSGGNREIIARNDDYNGLDPFVGIDLQPGTYYLGVSAKGNTNYDPTVSDTGYGGQSDGTYSLKLGFTTTSVTSIVDIDNPTLTPTALDGDADGQAGGTFNFWFETGNTIFVDKATSTPVVLQDGSLAKPFSTIAAATQKAGSRIVVPTNGPAGITDGDYFTISDGSNPTKFFEFDKNGGAGSVIGTNIRVNISGAVSVSDVVTAIATAINNVDPTRATFLTRATADTTNGLVDLTSASRLDVTNSPGLLKAQNILRIAGNGGADNNLGTINDDLPYVIGVDNFGTTLADGSNFDVPQGVTVMIDAGAVLKLQSANLDAGTSALEANRQNGAVQLLGTPGLQVYLTSFRNDAIGGDSDGASTGAGPGNWGGLVYRHDSDMNLGGTPTLGEDVYLNAVYQADLSYGGGQVNVAGNLDVYDPIHIVSQRPTVAFNRLTHSADAAISANPDSFDDSNNRIGPDVHGNTVMNNSINGLFVRIKTQFGTPIDKLSVNARFKSTDITYVIAENLVLTGNAGGDLVNNEIQQLNVLGNPTAGTFTINGVPVSWNATAAVIQSTLEGLFGTGCAKVTGGSLPQAPVVIQYINQAGSSNRAALAINSAGLTGGTVVATTVTEGGHNTARPGGRLLIDPGVVVKLGGARIEGERGSADLIAEGTAQDPVIFTSVKDDRYGGQSGTFDVGGDGFNTIATNTPAPGDWGGLEFQVDSRLSLDHAYVAYGGGQTPVEGGSGSFNAIELHEATGRIADSTFEYNANGTGAGGPDGKRADRESNDAAVVFVRGAQPVIVNNVFHNNYGSAVVSIDANALKAINVTDPGRATGGLEAYTQFANNEGPLVRLNRMANDLTQGAILGMQVRAGVLDTATVWDDTDIVHVLASGQITDDKFHEFGGLRLQSSPDASLVVKLGTGAGFDIGSSSQDLLEVIDRIGAAMQVVGAPGFPVVLTSLKDDAVGASLDPTGFPQTDTNGDGDYRTVPAAADPAPGDWNEILFDKYANDTNMAVVNEVEKPLTGGSDINGTPTKAQSLGDLAPDLKSDNENRRGGYEVHGHISSDAPSDVDVYSFTANAGTEVWLDIDKTDPALDSVLELIDSSGVVLARSQDDSTLTSLAVTALNMTKAPEFGGDFYATTIRDGGMRVTLPGTAGTTNTYYVRVRSNPMSGNLNDLKGGLTSGEYQLQVRLQQRDQQPGVAVKFADIRYATNGIVVLGLPYHSPLTGEGGEPLNTADASNMNGAIPLGNLLASDRGSVSVGGSLSSNADVDYYTFTLDYQQIQKIGGVSDGGKSWATVIDLDWADGLTRPDTTIALFDANHALIYVGRASNIQDDQPAPGQGQDVSDLTRGSVGPKDPYVGTAQLPATGATYYLAVVNNQQLPTVLDAQFVGGSTNTTVRLEPVTSIKRIAEDHIGFTGYDSNGSPVDPYGAYYDKNSAASAVAATTPLINIASATTLASSVVPLTFQDLVLFANGANTLATYDPLDGKLATQIRTDLGLNGPPTNTLQDEVMRSDGVLYGYERVDTNNGTNTNNGTAGKLVTLDTGTGAITTVGNDNVPSGSPPASTGTSAPGGANFEQVTNTDDVDALTFQRTGTTGTPPVPTYALYYSVQENGVSASTTGATTYNSKLYRADPNNGSVAFVTNQPWGIKGDIQLAGTSPATGSGPFFYGTNSGTISFQTRAQGTQGNGVRLILSRTPGGTQVTSAVNGVVSVQVNYNFGNNTPTTSIQTVVDTINADRGAQSILTAVVSSQNAGSGGTLVTGETTITALGGTDDASGKRIQGNVTGLAWGTFTGGTLYGVTSGEGATGRGGQLISIDPGSGTATIIRDFSASRIGTGAANGFQGLALGPQNVPIVVGKLATAIDAAVTTFTLTTLDSLPAGAFDLLIDAELMSATATSASTVSVVRTAAVATPHAAGAAASVPGYFKNTLFAVTQDGRLVAFDPTTGNGVVAFHSNDQVQTVSVLGNQTTLSTAINAAATTVPVANASVFPSLTPFDIQIGGELMTVRAVAGNVLTVTRGIDGTAAATHASGDGVFQKSGYFTLSFDNGTSLSTTAPLAFNAPGAVSLDEVQTVDDISYAGGAYTLDFVNNLYHTTSLAANVTLAGTTLTVQNGAAFPVATVASPFVIRVDAEDMLVQGHTAGSNAFTSVLRGYHGTPVALHSGNLASGTAVAPATVFEVLTTTLTGSLAAMPSTTLSAGISTGATAFDVASVAGFPPTPFTIRIDTEEMSVTGVAGNQLTVTRGTNEPSAAHGQYTAVTRVDATVNVLDGTSFPAVPFTIRIDNEDLRVTAVTAKTSFTVLRGYNGTSAAVSHAVGATVYRVETTGPLAYTATASQVASALNFLPSIAVSGGTVTGTAGPTGTPGTPATMTFSGGNLGRRDLFPLRGDNGNLIGDETQQLTLSGNTTSGQFRLLFGGNQTNLLDWNTDNLTVQAELENLPLIGTGNVQVTGGPFPGAPMTVKFQGFLQDKDVAQLGILDVSLQNNEVQRVTVTGGPTGGTFTLNLNDPFVGVKNVTLNWNDDVAAAQAAFDAQFGAGNTLISGGALPGAALLVEFRGLYGERNIASFILGANNLTGGTPSVQFLTVYQGNSEFTFPLPNGTPVSVTVTTTQDGNLSVSDALTSLPNGAISPATPDIQVTGGALPTSPVSVTFTGAFSGVSQRLLRVDNGAMLAGTTASIAITATPGTGSLPVTPILSSAALNGSRGLAFSPLDVNLWHPTFTRGDLSDGSVTPDPVAAPDPGHGINTSPDNTRTPSKPKELISDGLGHSRQQAQSVGGGSMYFGVENYQYPGNGYANTSYANYNADRAQLGVLDNNWQLDLTSNANIRNNYNTPGGAFGRLETNSIDLSRWTSRDKPTFYFSYLLDDGSPAGGVTTANSPLMRDSARAFVSVDGGTTWTLVATNNAALSTPTVNAELPIFLTDDSTYNGAPVQQLYPTANWRQARIDMSQFAGKADLRFRFDFSTAGKIGEAINPSAAPLPSEWAGQFSAEIGDSATSAAERGQNNAHEGFYVDDLIVGFAERGELVTSAPATPAGTTGFSDVYSGGFANGRANINNLGPTGTPSIITSGAYQFEIRRGTEYAAPASPTKPDYVINQTFDTNDRLISGQLTQQPPIVENFDAPPEFDEFNMNLFITGPGGASNEGNWATSDVESVTPANSFTSATVSNAGHWSSTELSNFATGDGSISFQVMVDAAANPTPFNPLTANAFQFFIDGVRQDIVVSGVTLPFQQLPGTGTVTPSFAPVAFPITAGTHTLEWRYYKGNANVVGNDAAFIDNLVIPQPATASRLGDQNVQREQGMVVIEGNYIHDIQSVGIQIDQASRDAGDNFPYVGPPRQTPVLNTARLTTSVLVVNNVVANFNSAGIYASGDANPANQPVAAVPMSKIINNTIVGTGIGIQGIGIEIIGTASPTVMNNIVANTNTGILIAASSANLPSPPDVTTTLFQNNQNNGNTGTNAILASSTAPLFVSAAKGDFYLAASQPGNPNQAIDSSLNTRTARLLYTGVTSPLGIPQQDMFAPTIDRFGQLRVDDPGTPNATGLGSNIYIDRGAIERADFLGPVAQMVSPLDNDAAGVDLDTTTTSIHIDPPAGSAPVTQFVVAIVDTGGIGVDDTSANQSSKYTLLEDGTPLVAGTDYVFAYNANTNQAIFTSASTFPLDHVYTIKIDNSAATGIRDLAGNVLSPNRSDGTAQFTILLGGHTSDFGDAPDSYGTTRAHNGAQHVLLPANPKYALYLGRGVDADPDGRPTATATGDDADYYVTPDTSGLTVVPLAPFVLQTPAADGVGGVTAGLPASLTIQDGLGSSVTLTFVRNGRGGANVINYYDGDQADALADRIVAGIATSTGLTGVTAMNLNGGAVQIDGASSVVAAGGNLQLANRLPAGLRLPATYISPGLDGKTFTVADGVSAPITFEFDNNHSTLGSTTVIEFSTGDSTYDLARKMVVATEAALTNLTAVVTPEPLGVYRVDLSSKPLPGTTDIRDDEDGVVFNGAFHPGLNNLTPLTVTASAPGYLDAWVDFNNDGVFDANEKICDSLPLVAGPNIVQVTTPPNAKIGLTYARFRLSTTGGLGPTGLAIGGEVEDYQVTIIAGLPPVAVDDSYTVAENTNLTTTDPYGTLTPAIASDNGVLANDTDADTDPAVTPWSALLVDSPAHAASFTLNLDGTFSYTPATNYSGPDTFTYFVRDNDPKGSLQSNVATVTLTVTPVNHSPTVTVPTSLAPVNEDTLSPIVDPANPIQVADVDVNEGTGAQRGQLQVTLSSNHGPLTIRGDVLGGLAPNQIAVGGTPGVLTGPTLVLTGTPPQINATLANSLGLLYRGDPNFNDNRGTETVTVIVNDLGNWGVPGPLSTTASFTVPVRPINDPPVLTVPQVVQRVDEGQPLSFLAGNSITVSDVDVDETPAPNNTLSVALTATHGTLAVNGGGITQTGATLTLVDTQTHIQAALASLTFTPTYTSTTHYYGSATLSVTLNDLGHTGLDPSTGLPSGGVDVTSTVTISVNPVNDPPVADVSGVTTKTVLEDTNLPLPGIVVGDPLDAPAIPTLLVTLKANFGKLTLRTDVPNGLNAGNVQFNGTSSVVVTASPALINTTLANATGLIYRGNQDFNNWRGQEMIQITVDDQGSFGTGGALQASSSFAVSVTPVNDAPLLQAPTGLLLNEDDPNYYIPIQVTDVDADEAPADPKQAVTVRLRLTDALGNAVTNAGTLAVNTSIPNGIDPTPVTGNGLLVGNGTADVTLSGSPVKVSTTLLDAQGLHFVPTLNYNGSLYLVVTVDDHGNTGPNSPSNPGTSLRDNRTIPLTILAVNDAPVLAGIGSGPLAYTEKDPAKSLTQAITVSDVDNVTQASATVQITGNYQNGQDVLAFTNTAAITATWDATTGKLTLTGTDTLANYQAALRSVTYRNTSFNPSSLTRTVTFTINDGSLNSIPVTRDISVTPVNDPPVFTLIETTPLVYTEADPATLVTNTLTLSDPDSTQLVGGTVRLSPNFQPEDVLSFVATATIAGTWDAASGTLTLTGTDTLANYQAVFRSVRYRNTSNNPSPVQRIITFAANDGSAVNNLGTGTRQITVVSVNTPPVLAGLEITTLAYTEKDPATLITNALAISDADNPTLASATVSITAGFAAGQDQLAANTTGTSITASYNAATGVLTLAGSDLVANYQAVLRSVTYQNTSLNPSSAARSVSFKVNDGTIDSNPLSRAISVTPVNDPPVLAGMETTALAYREKDPATAIASFVTATDPDNTTLSSATVQIATGYQSGEDLLAFVNSSGITGSWDATGGTLTLSGVASLANYQAALRSVKYQNLSSNPIAAQRIVALTVNDGSLNSNVETRAITVTPVNDPPVLAGIAGTTLVYVAGDPATALCTTVSVSDPDNTTLSSATVQIATGYQSGEDLLAFVNSSGIAGSWNATGGTLTLSGVASLANYQAALRAVKYRNLNSSNPSTLSRTVAFTASDGSSSSNVVTMTITVNRLNAPPVAVNDAYTIPDNAVLDTVNAGLPSVLANDTDAENDTLQVIVASSDVASAKGASVVLNANGNFVYDPTVSLTLSALRPGQTLTDTFFYTLGEIGSTGTSRGTVTITVTGANSNPIAGPDMYSTAANEVLQVAAAGVLVNDRDPEGSPVAVVAQTLTSTKGASVQLFANGSLAYDPTQSFQLRTLAVGATTNDTFTYQVTDGEGGLGTGTVTVVVTGMPSNPYQNPAKHTDVTGDGFTSPLDALVLINYINTHSVATLPPGLPTPPYLDVNGDGNCTASDVLDVIAALNNAAGAGGEGEAAPVNSPAGGPSVLPDHAGSGATSAAFWNGAPAAPAPQAGLIGVPFGPILVNTVSAVSQDTAVAAAALNRLSAVATAKPQTSSAFDDWSTDAWDGDESLTQIADGLHHVRRAETAVDEVFRSL